MVLSFAVMIPGALLYLSRPVTGSSITRLAVERGFIMAAIVLTALGLLLFSEYLIVPTARAWARIGAHLYLMGAVLVIANEGLALSHRGAAYSLEVMYVVLALLGEAAVGLAIVRSERLPPVLGWITIAWNLLWLVILPLSTPSEMYFPVLHHVMPLTIGIALLVDSGEPEAAG